MKIIKIINGFIQSSRNYLILFFVRYHLDSIFILIYGLKILISYKDLINELPNVTNTYPKHHIFSRSCFKKRLNNDCCLRDLNKIL